MIKILFLTANPTDTLSLRLDEESRAIEQVLLQSDLRDHIKIEQHWAVRASDLQSLLLRNKPNIVHFSGHGSKNSEIILQDDNGSSHPISGQALKELFSHLKDNIRCVVLNACYSESQASAISENIDFVIGMSDALGDEAAVKFSAAFYQALGFGRDLQTAFELGRLQIGLARLDGQDILKLLTRIENTEKFTFRVESHDNDLEVATVSFEKRKLDEPIFKREDKYYQEHRVETIAQNLREWKIVHSSVQNLLFSTDSLLDMFNLFRQEPTESIANEFERQWIRYCEPKAKKIRQSFVNLQLARNYRIEELLLMLQGEESIVYAVQYLSIDDMQSIRRLQNAIYMLVDTLKEVLIVADLHITQLADHLISI